MQNKKPWLYLAAVALVLLALKYSDALFGGIRCSSRCSCPCCWAAAWPMC